ncbi:hypothetical protein DM01DRAFT_326030 [Hesseltinella vesiculosa]|uniref:Uncharacterized protein n=1 Tax=Hesseltinella vesiculosa TaxID=101127 RepID=A0A1X2GUG8_9FUNG|nr:hypothetical protein DM01DRAFT_326030 [Hesseltinella vesiculosa]
MPPLPMTAAEAACIVLGYDSNVATNHELAMLRLKEMDFVPVYLHDSNPVHPTAISTKVQQMNPFVYITYPTEVTVEHDSSLHHGVKRRNESISRVPSECSDDSITSASNEKILSSAQSNSVNITKEEALTYLKNVMFLEQPVTNNSLYEQIYVDSKRLKTILEKRFGPLNTTPRQIETWASKSKLFGMRRRLRHDGAHTRGRLLWVRKDKYLEVNDMSDLVKYRTH